MFQLNQAERERENSTFLLFKKILFRTSIGWVMPVSLWMMPTHPFGGEGNLLYPVHPFKC